jgi:hypothetical protein
MRNYPQLVLNMPHKLDANQPAASTNLFQLSEYYAQHSLLRAITASTPFSTLQDGAVVATVCTVQQHNKCTDDNSKSTTTIATARRKYRTLYNLHQYE